MKAVIYARYSSHAQRDESIEGQLRECKDFAQKNGLIVIDEYIDRALTGKNDNRPDFQRLIRDSDKHRFDAVIMYTLDRFARNRYDSAIYKAKLKKNGVKLYYAKQPMPDTPEGIILESVLEGYAEYYSENLSRNIKRGLKENARHGIAQHKVCLGYRAGADRKYEIEQVGAAAVKLIFTLCDEGYNDAYIVRYLNEKGYKTSTGKAFTYNSLHSIYANKKYIGIYEYGDVYLENAVPRIIDDDLFNRVQEKRMRNSKARARNKAKEEYLLTTKLFCGHCGSPMVGESGTSRHGKLYHYYKCSNRKRGGKCKKKTERKDWIEELVVRYTVEKVLTDENIDLIATRAIAIIDKENADTSLLKQLRAELQDADDKIKNIMTAIENGVFTPTTKDRLQELESIKYEVTAQLAKEEMKKPALTKEHIVYWLNSFKAGDIRSVEYQRTIIDTLVNSVYIYDDEGGGERTRKVVITFNISGQNTHTISGSDIARISPPGSSRRVFLRLLFYAARRKNAVV